MKIRVTLKDPDGVWDSLKAAGIDPNDMESRVEDVVSRFVKYREYVTIELDTETLSAEVIPA